MFSVQPGVPVNLSKVEGEAAFRFMVLNDIIWFSCDQLHFEKPKLRVYAVKFIDYCLDVFVFLI